MGDSSNSEEGSYSAKVMAEQARLKEVARGIRVPTTPLTPLTTLTTASSGLVGNLWEKAQKLTLFNEENPETK